MLDGWYCRSMANQQAGGNEQQHHENDDEIDENVNDSAGSEEDSQDEGISRINQKLIDYRSQYHNIKKKLKFLLYENEYFQDALRSSQRRLLKVTRDKSFLLDRLLQYEKPDVTSSESDETETSDDENNASRIDVTKKRKLENSLGLVQQVNSGQKLQNAVKRKRAQAKKANNFSQIHQNISLSGVLADGHMTAEEVERHLQSRQSLMELVPEKAPPTVPNEMFSNEPSLDSESNDQLIETSPSNVGEDCLSVDMN